MAAAALVLAGCANGSSSGSTESSSGSAATNGGGSKVCVIGGTDAFSAVVKNGADAAGAAVTAAGSEYVWIPLADYDNIGPDMVELTEQAVSQDCTSISRAVQDAIAKDPTIDGLTASSAAAADAIADALKATGKTDSIKLGSLVISANILDRISEGTQLVAVDQQGWLQGWLAVSAAWQYNDYAILPATPIILTGPAFVTADNVDTVKASFATGYR